MLDPVEHPHEWVQAYAGKIEEPLYQGCTGEFGEARVQELAKRQAVSFRLPAAQDNKSGLWNPAHSLTTPGHYDFMPHHSFQDMWDILETRKEQTLVLAKALQCCTK